MEKLLEHIKIVPKNKRFTTPLELSEFEKKEIVQTLNVLSAKKMRKSKSLVEHYGTSIVKEMTEQDAEEIKDFIKVREPELWERNILMLEKGEWDENMPDDAFKRWKKERPKILKDSFFESKSAPNSPVQIKKEQSKHPRT